MNKTTYPEHLVGKEIHVILRSFYGMRSPTDPYRMMTLIDIEASLHDYVNTGVWSLCGLSKDNFFIYDDAGDRHYLDGTVMDKRERGQQFAEPTGVYLESVEGITKEIKDI